jgi:IS1 family transposase
MLVEGSSLRAASRLANVSINTVTKLLVDVGAACSRYQDDHLRNVYARRVQCDEMWSFCYAKARNVPEERKAQFGCGDVWTWAAIDADSKLVLSWCIGGRDSYTALAFMQDVARRLAQRVQLTTDGHKAYLDAVEPAFGQNIDYAMLQKLYGSDPEQEKRYSPAKCVGTDVEIIQGKPDPKHVSTSYVERQNLTMPMGIRRFTRLTNAFSKKVESHGHAVALHFMYYNFARVQKTLGMTPAMAASITGHAWTLSEIARLAN